MFGAVERGGRVRATVVGGPSVSGVEARALVTDVVKAESRLYTDDAPIYRVAAGDNLRSIAEQVYGGQDAWLSIYAANRGLIGPDPNALATGAALRLPPALPGQH